MSEIIKSLIMIFISFSGGLIISSAIFAFIAIIGIVPSIAVKTNTTASIVFYEEMILYGGIFGCINSIYKYNLHFENSIITIFMVVLYFLFTGIFIGVLASSLAECLNVIPIFTSRVNIREGVFLIMISMAIGKFIGSILYFTNSGFRV